MKNTFLLIFLSLLLFRPIGANPPDKIYSITQLEQTGDYYKEQAEAWRTTVTSRPTDSDAWLNYFKAARYANMFVEAQSGFDLAAIVGEIQKTIPESWVAPYLNYVAAGRIPEAYSQLLEAYKRAPEEQDLWPDMVTYYASTDQLQLQREMLEKWFDSGTYSPGLLQSAYNMLQSVEPQGVLLTWGDNDTYPLWMLQHVKNVRTDVQVLNAYLLANVPDYRDHHLKRMGLQFVPDAQFESARWTTRINDLLSVLATPRYPVYFAIGAPTPVREKFGENLYLTGLAFKYGQRPEDQKALLAQNMMQAFHWNFLELDLEPALTARMVHNYNTNYISGLLATFDYYREMGQYEQANIVKKRALILAERAGQLGVIRPHFEKETPLVDWETEIDIRQLQKDLRPISNRVHLNINEVSNKDYEKFLTHLLRNKQYDLLEAYRVQPTNWRALAPEVFQSMPEEEIFYFHPDGPNMPVQNISYEAAEAYCAWLTTVYSNATDRRKKYPSVRFRLPTKAEWEEAARGKKPVADYPWGSGFYRNSKGCYLSNFDVSKEAVDPNCSNSYMRQARDGGIFTTPVATYFPNELGFYNMAGNVAEMVQEREVVKGGSWATTPQTGKIADDQKITTPSPEVGFRIAMEILP